MQELIEQITALLQEQPQILAAWLGGSYGRGEEDRYSDADIIVCTPQPETTDLFNRLQDILRQRADIIFIKTLPCSLTINAITDLWQRFDITVIDKSSLNNYGQNEIRFLYDDDDISGLMPEFIQKKSLIPFELKDVTEEFIRVLGLLPVVIGREDFVTAMSGVQILKDLLIRLIKMSMPCSDAGALSLKKHLPDQDYKILLAMPPLTQTRHAILQANIYLADAFFLKAKNQYEQHNMAWPERFVKATALYLEAQLHTKIL